MSYLVRLARQAVSSANDNVRFRDAKWDLDLAYILPNVIAMGFPSAGVEAAWRNDINTVAAFLNERHGSSYMVWNLSNRSYDTEKFGNRVVDFGFQNHHAPPLELLFEIVNSMHSWLTMDSQNVAVVHCMAGKARTGTVIASYLVYSGMFQDAFEALDFYTSKRSTRGDTFAVAVPSQQRFVRYFVDAFLGRVPVDLRNPPILKLDRIIVNTIPNFDNQGGCRPSVKIFKGVGGTLVYTSTDRLQTCYASDLSMSFVVNKAVKGDVLLHLYHNTRGFVKEVFMFRFSFHTAFVPHGVLRLKRNEVDEACKDRRFDPDFFMDLFFSTLETNEVSPSNTQETTRPLDTLPPPPPRRVSASLHKAEGAHSPQTTQETQETQETRSEEKGYSENTGDPLGVVHGSVSPTPPHHKKKGVRSRTRSRLALIEQADDQPDPSSKETTVPILHASSTRDSLDAEFDALLAQGSPDGVETHETPEELHAIFGDSPMP